MIEVNEKIRNTLATLPKKPGCYLMKDVNDKIIYVGKAINLRNRVKSYFINDAGHTEKTRQLVRHIEAADALGKRDKACKLLVGHGRGRFDQRLPVLLEDRRRLELLPEGQVQPDAVAAFRQTDPVVDHPILLIANVRGRRSQDQL